MKRYQRRVYGMALRIVRRHDVADDVTQEAFLRAWQARSASFDLGAALRALGLPDRRQPGRQPRALAAGPRGGPARGARRDAGRPRRDRSARVLDAEARGSSRGRWRSCPRSSAPCFVLRVVEELSYEEIAETLGICPGHGDEPAVPGARAAGARRSRPYLGAAAQRGRRAA